MNQYRNHIINLKRMNFNKQTFLLRLWNSSPGAKVYSILNEMRFNFTDKNVRTLVACDVKQNSDDFTQYNAETSSFKKNKFLYFVLNRQIPDHHSPVSPKLLKFYVRGTLDNFFINFSKKLLSLSKKTVSKEELEKQWGGPEAYKLIIFIKDDFNEIVNKHPSVLVFFSADWCQHCLRLRTHYGTAALMAKEANLSIAFATFDVTSNPDIADENGVVGIPTIKYYKNGKIVSTFRGKRVADEVFAYAKNPLQSPVESKKADV